MVNPTCFSGVSDFHRVSLFLLVLRRESPISLPSPTGHQPSGDSNHHPATNKVWGKCVTLHDTPLFSCSPSYIP